MVYVCLAVTDLKINSMFFIKKLVEDIFEIMSIKSKYEKEIEILNFLGLKKMMIDTNLK